jgi:uncharacterized protein YjbI with pentapeptide repeats
VRALRQNRPVTRAQDDVRVLLQADCSRCFGLCCVALPFARSADFADDKAAGVACRNLQADFRCRIHDRLRTSGFRGCTVFDCRGAGQRVSQETFSGRDWRGDEQLARQMFAVFPVMLHLHDLLGHLTAGLALLGADADAVLRSELRRALERVQDVASGTPEALLALDRGALHSEVADLLERAGNTVRAAAAPGGADHRGADLMGADLREARLAGATFRGALLVAARLEGADLRWADLLGADLRDARFAGADLSRAMFLTQSQVEAAHGDVHTVLPAGLTRPSHWQA